MVTVTGVEVQQLAPGLWRWTAAHPDWTPDEGGDEGWEPEVGCVYCETGDGVVLVDPLVPADPVEAERFWRALDRDLERVGGSPSVLLTVYWHARSAREVAARYPGTRVHASDAARDEMAKRTDVTDWLAPGDALPGGITAHPTPYRGEVVYWLPTHAALVPGDVLLGDRAGGIRVVPESWLGEGVTREQVREALLPLLDLRVERVLVSHGAPVLSGGREALARALAP
jgi:glyoxylase-like metal-dependent hydrolase (beta-lactamase superfamily II)